MFIHAWRVLGKVDPLKLTPLHVKPQLIAFDLKVRFDPGDVVVDSTRRTLDSRCCLYSEESRHQTLPCHRRPGYIVVQCRCGLQPVENRCSCCLSAEFLTGEKLWITTITTQNLWRTPSSSIIIIIDLINIWRIFFSYLLCIINFCYVLLSIIYHLDSCTYTIGFYGKTWDIYHYYIY